MAVEVFRSACDLSGQPLVQLQGCSVSFERNYGGDARTCHDPGDTSETLNTRSNSALWQKLLTKQAAKHIHL